MAISERWQHLDEGTDRERWGVDFDNGTRVEVWYDTQDAPGWAYRLCGPYSMDEGDDVIDAGMLDETDPEAVESALAEALRQVI